MLTRRPAPAPHANLVLIGGRGCGKSSIARRILRANKHFMLFSLDHLIRYEAGAASIPTIVAERGWEGFRELEWEVVQKVSAFRERALVDCGGGVVVDLDEGGEEVYSERKVGALREHGLVVYLERDIDYLEAKVAGDQNRPDLSSLRSFREIMERRDPWYRRAAHRVIRCGERSKRAIADELLTWFYDESGS